MSSLRRWLSSKMNNLAGLAAAAVLCVGLVACAGASADNRVPAQVAPSKYAAIVVDTTTGSVLYEAHADARRYPASLTKMMTLYVLFEELERGRFKLGSPLKVSALAQRQAPTKLGLRAGETIAVEDAIRGLITRSANDAAVAIAENVAGSVPAFAARMTRTARALGMTRTHFSNPNGLPDPDNYSTARDLMKLGLALQVRFPRYYPYFSISSFTFRGRYVGNHNKLLGRIDGVDGIKTGYVRASGFNIVTSLKRGGRKLVVVVMGGKSGAQRDALVGQLISAYLPRAARGRGYDDDLVADLRSVSKVAGGRTAAPAGEIDDHPAPLPRPSEPAAPLALADPAATAPTPVANPRVQEAEAAPPAPPLPEPMPARLAGANLPSSASEAFADVTPPKKPDLLAALVDKTAAAGRPYRVASAGAAIAADDTPVTASVTARTMPAGGWVVQIGAVDSERAALSLLERARSAVGSPLTRAHPFTETVRKDGQTFVRARFAGFSDRQAANRACSALKKNEFKCISMRL